MRGKSITKCPKAVDRKLPRFGHTLDLWHMNTHSHDGQSSQSLGHALRQIRKNKKWTLKDFERASGGLIKDVVLGSYERGSRSISVSNLELITSIYEIPTSSLFPDKSKSTEITSHLRVIIDLRRLREASTQKKSELLFSLNRFTDGIIHLRKDWNGEILSIRSNDLDYLSIFSRGNLEHILQEMHDSGVLIKTIGANLHE